MAARALASGGIATVICTCALATAPQLAEGGDARWVHSDTAATVLAAHREVAAVWVDSEAAVQLQAAPTTTLQKLWHLALVRRGELVAPLATLAHDSTVWLP